MKAQINSENLQIEEYRLQVRLEIKALHDMSKGIRQHLMYLTAYGYANNLTDVHVSVTDATTLCLALADSVSMQLMK